MPESSSAELFDLFASRVIRLQEGDRSFTITCKRPAADDWRDYFRAISITSERNGAELINLLDMETPRLRLAERVILKADGYTVADGKKLTDLPNWVSRLPLAHRKAVGIALSDVRPNSESGDFAIQPEGEEILIDAFWSAIPADREEWKSLRFTGLKHIFKTPQQSHYKRYNQEASRSVVVGGSRNGRNRLHRRSGGPLRALRRAHHLLRGLLLGWRVPAQHGGDSRQDGPPPQVHRRPGSLRAAGPRPDGRRKRRRVSQLIHVERDTEGLHQALVCLFEEALILHRSQGARERAADDPETLARLDADIPPREISPGYFRRAAYLLDLSTALELGIPTEPTEILHTDVLGLTAVKGARAAYEREHPACPSCGERQDNPWMKQCFHCQTKFAGRGN